MEQEYATLTWRERGGPVVAPPQGKGFGSELIARLLAHQPGARLDHSWDKKGLTVTLRLLVEEGEAA
jgi:two-component sensor histidine kinase